MYAETDFYLAFLKERDWLKENALKIYSKYKEDIWTSQITTQELLMYAYRYKINPITFLDSFYDMADVVDVKLNGDFFLFTVHVMNNYSTTPFDAMHAVVASEDGTIISSDSIYDRIGLKRIKLEERS